MSDFETISDRATPRGRDAELDQLSALLNRPSPAHVSLVGPRSIGKTLVMRALAERAVAWTPFVAVAQWDLRRHTPADDGAFFAGLAAAVADALEGEHPEYAGVLRDEPGIETLQDVFGALEEEGRPVLLLIDHLDYALRQPSITKDLWDNLRDLAVRGALVLVTATRKRLRELTDADSRTSEFWNVFAPPVELGPFSEAGLEAFLAPLAKAKGPLSPPARKEFARQTGGVPLLAVVLAERLASAPSPTVEKAALSEVAAELARQNDHVADLWADVPAPTQALLVELSARGEDGIPATDIPRDRLVDLERRGYASRTSAGHLAPSARMMLDHAALHAASAGDLGRLFSAGADANANMRALLELQLAAIPDGDPVLRNDAERALRDLHPNPVRALGALREFAHAALNAIWEVAAPDRTLPRGTVDAWYRDTQNWVKRRAIPLVEQTGYRIPSSRKDQEGVLNLLCDPSLAGDAPISDGTYRLIVAIRELGNYGHHVNDSGSESVPFETACAACGLGVDLFRRLAAELPSPSDATRPLDG